MRVALLVEYDGTAYAGWQRQKNALSIQQVMEQAISKLTGEACQLHSSGRTDAGVHARGQVAHFDTLSRIPPERFSYALNTMLPKDIKVLQSVCAADDFHARFSAKRKTYRYAIDNSKSGTALLRNIYTHVPQKLNCALMHEAGLYLVGQHDFAAFMAAGSPVKSTVRSVYSCHVFAKGHHIYMDVCANGFLYNMMRIIAGTRIRVGQKKISADSVLHIISGKNRVDAGFTAPAQGLCLMNVDYGYNIFDAVAAI
jgi:tRNA pseudouridine38-40 synthase